MTERDPPENGPSLNGDEEHFSLELDNRLLREREVAINERRAANMIALILTWALATSLPLYLFVLALIPTNNADVVSVNTIFDKWYSVVSPLIGGAVGYYFGTLHRRQHS